MAFIKRHWSAILGAISNLPSLWHALVWLFDWGARVDLVATKLREHGGINVMLGFFVDPPPWLVLVTLPVGLLLIFWDLKGRPIPWRKYQAGQSIDRITCVEFLKTATNKGWNFTDQHSLHLIDLQDAMRQGGVDGSLTIWGRLNRWPNAEMIMRSEVIEKIPADHWKEFRVHLFATLDNDNFHTYSWHIKPSTTAEKKYVDLHVGREESTKWLQQHAAAFKGRTTLSTRCT
jgi:hypothetical protein